MTEYTSLENKVALITGAGTGIGLGIAQALAREKARLVICGRRKDRLDTASASLQSAGAEVLAVQADISDPSDVERLFQVALSRFGRIDILVNNAGVSDGEEVHRMEVETWERVMDINLRGPFLTTRRVLPLMREQHSGHIINISSESGLEYYEGDGAYGLSKHALNDFGEYVQRENQSFNIRVNTICPGMVVTEMSQDSPGLDHSKCLYPEDIADLAIWLLTRRWNIKIGTPILIQTMLNPWE